MHWITRFIRFHQRRHPRELREDQVTAFLTHLAVREDVSASTQNQAPSALLSCRRPLPAPCGRPD